MARTGNNINQNHYGTGDNVGNDKVISSNEKSWIREIILGVSVLIIGAFIIGFLHYHHISFF